MIVRQLARGCPQLVEGAGDLASQPETQRARHRQDCHQPDHAVPTQIFGQEVGQRRVQQGRLRKADDDDVSPAGFADDLLRDNPILAKDALLGVHRLSCRLQSLQHRRRDILSQHLVSIRIEEVAAAQRNVDRREVFPQGDGAFVLENLGGLPCPQVHTRPVPLAPERVILGARVRRGLRMHGPNGDRVTLTKE
jgi:hypothetical protein